MHKLFTAVSLTAAGFVSLSLAGCNDAPATKGSASEADIAAEMAETQTMQPGQYEAEIAFLRFEIPGLPASALAQAREQMTRETATKRSYCLTEAEAQRSQQDRLKEMGNAQGDCSFARFEVDGEAIDAELRCTGMPGNNSVTMAMAGTMGNDASDVRITSTLANPAVPSANATIEMRVQTRRTGDCTAASRAEAEAGAPAETPTAP